MPGFGYRRRNNGRATQRANNTQPATPVGAAAQAVGSNDLISSLLDARKSGSPQVGPSSPQDTFFTEITQGYLGDLIKGEDIPPDAILGIVGRVIHEGNDLLNPGPEGRNARVGDQQSGPANSSGTGPANGGSRGRGGTGQGGIQTANAALQLPTVDPEQAMALMLSGQLHSSQAPASLEIDPALSQGLMLNYSRAVHQRDHRAKGGFLVRTANGQTQWRDGDPAAPDAVQLAPGEVLLASGGVRAPGEDGNALSFSRDEVAGLIDSGMGTLSLQSRSTTFVLSRSAELEAQLDEMDAAEREALYWQVFEAYDQAYNKALGGGGSESAASTAAVSAVADRFGMIYYEGQGSSLARVTATQALAEAQQVGQQQRSSGGQASPAGRQQQTGRRQGSANQGNRAPSQGSSSSGQGNNRAGRSGRSNRTNGQRTSSGRTSRSGGASGRGNRSGGRNNRTGSSGRSSRARNNGRSRAR